MQQNSSSNRAQEPEHVEADADPSLDEEHPRTALGEVLHEVEEAGNRVVDDGARRGEDGESGDAMTPNEEEQEHDEQGGA
ncbi:hypothetical protein ACFWMX_31540 [Streptomyces sp. NPDC058378]|uniref:hypothetical protein n=1 Tax=unclassified Streptomyces TaxID=2593676 RepID=UPI003646CC79